MAEMIKFHLVDEDSLEDVIASINAMRPEMKKMADALSTITFIDVERYISNSDIDACILLADAFTKRLRYLADYKYADSANMDEAETFLSYALMNLKGVENEIYGINKI